MRSVSRGSSRLVLALLTVTLLPGALTAQTELSPQENEQLQQLLSEHKRHRHVNADRIRIQRRSATILVASREQTIASFLLEARGATSEFYELSCSASGVAEDCVVSQHGVHLVDGRPTRVSIRYSTSGPGVGALTLEVRGTNAGTRETYGIVARPQQGEEGDVAYLAVPGDGGSSAVYVTPDGGLASAGSFTSGNTVTFWIENDASSARTFALSCDRTGSVSSCTPSSTSVSIPAFGIVSRSVTYATGPDGSGTVTLTATRDPESDVGSYTVDVDGTPEVAAELALHNDQFLDPERCFAECFHNLVRYTIPGYVSLDVHRGPTLVYSSATHVPRPLILVDATPPAHTQTPPEKLSISVRVNGVSRPHAVTGLSEVFYSYGDTQLRTARLGFQFVPNPDTTGVYPVTVEIRAYWGTSFETTVVTGRVIIVNESNSPFGAGWSLAGVPRLIRTDANGSALITREGGQAAYFYRYCATCSFAQPDGQFSILSQQADGTYVQTFQDGSRTVFTATGSPSYAEEAFGNRVTFIWTSGRLTALRDPVGRDIQISYAASGKAFEIFFNDYNALTNVTARFGFSGANLGTLSIGDLNNRIDWLSTTATFGYGPHGLTSIDNSMWGSRTDFGYDALGRLASVVLPAMRVDGGILTLPTVSQSSAESGVVAETLAGYGSSTSSASRILAAGIVATQTLPGQPTVQARLNRFGLPLETTVAGKTQLVQRNADGQPLVSTSSLGRSITTTYDYRGRATVIDDNTTATTTQLSYDTRNRLTLVRGVGGRDSIYYLDGTDGRTQRIDRFVNGRLLGKTFLDSRGRVSREENPQGFADTYSYNLTNGNFDSRSQDELYRGRIFSSRGYSIGYFRQEADSGRIAFDGLGRITGLLRRWTEGDPILDNWLAVQGIDHCITEREPCRVLRDALGGMTTYYPDGMGHDTAIVYPDGTRERFTYDVAGRVKTRTTRSQEVISFGYDVPGRLTSMGGSGFADITVSYPNDTTVVYTNANSTDSLVFDRTGLLRRQVTVRPSGVYRATLTYDNEGRLKTVVDPWGETYLSLAYDSEGRIATSSFYGRTTTNDFDPATGARRGINLPTGVRLQPSFTQDYRAWNVDVMSGSVPHTTLDRKFGFGRTFFGPYTIHVYNGDFTERTSYLWDLWQSATYTGRLQSMGRYTRPDAASCPPDPVNGANCLNPTQGWVLAEQANYVFDLNGNRRDGNAVYAPNSPNRLLGISGQTLTYLPTGELREKTGPGGWLRLTWNSANQVTQVETTTGNTTLAYDALGQLIRRTSGDSAEELIYFGGRFAWRVHSNGSPRIAIGYSSQGFVSGVMEGTSFYQAYTNHRGDLVGLTTGTNVVTFEARYEPWGVRTVISGTNPTDIGFTGGLMERTSGLYRFGVRYYDPTLRRFVSEDPLGVRTGMNPYEYAAGDPVHFIDASGLDECQRLNHFDPGLAAESDFVYKTFNYGNNEVFFYCNWGSEPEDPRAEIIHVTLDPIIVEGRRAWDDFEVPGGSWDPYSESFDDLVRGGGGGGSHGSPAAQDLEELPRLDQAEYLACVRWQFQALDFLPSSTIASVIGPTSAAVVEIGSALSWYYDWQEADIPAWRKTVSAGAWVANQAGSIAASVAPQHWAGQLGYALDISTLAINNIALTGSWTGGVEEACP